MEDDRENPDNVILVCRECSKKMYPNAGTYKRLDIGSFAKLRFTCGLNNEHMWLRVLTECGNGKYEGRLDNDPFMTYEKFQYGDIITFWVEEVEDVRNGFE